jgi:hypothetical protein
METRKPTIGHIIIYRTDGRNGLSYDLPAMINCTRDTHPGDYPAAWDVHREGWPDGCIPGDVPVGCNGVAIEVARGMGIVHKSHLELCSVHGPKKNPLPVPESDMHVHLTVFTPGGYGTVVTQKADNPLGAEINDQPESEDFVGALALIPGSGSYVEHNVPPATEFLNNPDNMRAELRTWRWPVINNG